MVRVLKTERKRLKNPDVILQTLCAEKVVHLIGWEMDQHPLTILAFPSVNRNPFRTPMSALDSDAGTGGGPAEPRPCPSINGTPAGGFACKAGFRRRTTAAALHLKRKQDEYQMAGVMKAAPAGLETLCLDGVCNPIGEGTSC